MKKSLLFTVLLFTVMNIFPSGNSEKGTPDNGFNVTDSYGRTVYLEKKPETIISAAPNITEIIFALGRGYMLEGRTDYCDYPEEAFSIPSIGTLTDPNMEIIAAASPDLVIGASHFTQDSVFKLESLSIPVVVYKEENSFDGLYRTISNIAFLTGAEEEGRKLIEKMKADENMVKTVVKDQPEPKVYYAMSIGDLGDFTAGGDTFISEIIEIAGGLNIASEISGWTFSLEKILQYNPDIIICPEGRNIKEQLSSANGYRDLAAVKKGSVYEINADLLEIQGPRMTEGLKLLAEIFHPAVFR